MNEAPATPPAKADAKVDAAAVKKVENPDKISMDTPEKKEEKEEAAPALNSADPAKGLKEEEAKEEKKEEKATEDKEEKKKPAKEDAEKKDEKKEEATEAKPAKEAKAEKEVTKKAETKEDKDVKKLEKEVPDLDDKKYPGCPSTECVSKMADEVEIKTATKALKAAKEDLESA